MAKTKAELMAEKMQQQRVGKAAFEAGSKPAVETIPTAPAPVQEAQGEDLTDFVEPSQTQGRKGQKTPRMNLAIPPRAYEIIRRESRKRGMTYSEFLCALVYQWADNNK